VAKRKRLVAGGGARVNGNAITDEAYRIVMEPGNPRFFGPRRSTASCVRRDTVYGFLTASLSLQRHEIAGTLPKSSPIRSYSDASTPNAQEDRCAAEPSFQSLTCVDLLGTT